MKRNSKQFLALFMAVAMSVTPVSYAYAEDSAVALSLIHISEPTRP